LHLFIISTLITSFEWTQSYQLGFVLVISAPLWLADEEPHHSQPAASDDEQTTTSWRVPGY
jgi:hypothetical protein